MTDFIFLRPYAFFIIIPLSLLFYFSSTRKTKQQSYISVNLLDILIKNRPQHSKISISLILFLFSSLIITALAGPAIVKKTALVKTNSNTIILVGMDKTMYADDLKKSRLAFTKNELISYIKKSKTTNIALIAFSGSAHIISPFTDDHGTLIHFIESLNPNVMPKQGSSVPEAIKLAGSFATQLQPNSKVKIILITDQLTTLQSEEIINYLHPFNWLVDIIAVGSPTGSVVPLPNGGLLRSNTGQLIVAKTPLTVMQDTADKLKGNLIKIENFDQYANHDQNNIQKTTDEAFIYTEVGYWLLLPLLLMPVLFRRGYIFLLLFFISLPDYSYARDQALTLYEQGKYREAMVLFENPVWKGNALYRKKDYEGAIRYYMKSNTDVSHYNQGNAFAHIGKIKEAILEYNNALQLNSNLLEAKENKAILELWLKNKAPENKDDTIINSLKNKDKNIEKALNFLKALPEEPGDLMQKRLQLQQKKKSD